MRSVGWTTATSFLLATTCLQAASQPSPDLARTLQLTTAGQEVQIAGVSAGGTMVLLGIAREPLAGAASVESWVRTLTDDDGDGLVALDIERAVPLKSAWGAIDLATGNAGVTVAAGFPLDVVRPGAAGFEFDPVAQTPLLRLDRETVHFLLVRPGVGAWAMKAYDGGRGDTGNLEEGIPDGTLRVDPRTSRH